MRINTGKTKWRLKKIIRTLAERSFLTSLFLIILALAIGGALFYKYNVLLNRYEPKAGESILKLQKQIYQNVLDEWERMNENFGKVDFKNYVNPFLITED